MSNPNIFAEFRLLNVLLGAESLSLVNIKVYLKYAPRFVSKLHWFLYTLSCRCSKQRLVCLWILWLCRHSLHRRSQSLETALFVRWDNSYWFLKLTNTLWTWRPTADSQHYHTTNSHSSSPTRTDNSRLRTHTSSNGEEGLHYNWPVSANFAASFIWQDAQGSWFGRSVRYISSFFLIRFAHHSLE